MDGYLTNGFYADFGGFDYCRHLSGAGSEFYARWPVLYGKSSYARIFDWDWRSSHNSLKQFLAGIAITVAINAIGPKYDAKELDLSFTERLAGSICILFLFCFYLRMFYFSRWELYYIYAEMQIVKLPGKSDDVFAFLSMNYFGVTTGLFFLLGITAAAYSSVDSSLTSLTTSFSIDFLKIDPKDPLQKRRRIGVHLTFSLLMCIVVILFRELNNTSVVNAVLKAVGYTYGPILGLFTFGLITNIR